MIRLPVLKMVLVGLALIAGSYPLLTSLFHRWNMSTGDQMILGIYFPIGIFLLLAARDPSTSRTLIAFWICLRLHSSALFVSRFLC